MPSRRQRRRVPSWKLCEATPKMAKSRPRLPACGALWRRASRPQPRRTRRCAISATWRAAPTTSGSAQKNLYFGDYLSASMLGDRREVTVATSEHAYFTSDGFGVRAISRFTVNIHGDGRASTYGPIVALKTT
jgi:hypothetical protein